MRLTNQIKSQIANFYVKNKLNNRKSKYKIIQNYLLNEHHFIISINRLRIFVKQWFLTGNCNFKYFFISIVDNIYLCCFKLGSFTTENKLMNVDKSKITENELKRLHYTIYHHREYTALRLKNKLNLRASVSSIRRYINLLGWRKIRTRYCQIVSVKNKIERWLFSRLCNYLYS